MAWLIYDPSGKPVGLLAAGESPDALRANGYTVNEVSDADVTTDASGQVMVSIAALQQQQAIANSLQAAAALRQVEQNQINAYGAQTTRLGQVVPLVGQAQNYGLLANITAGDARAPYLSVPAGLSRMAGPSPIQSDYSQAKTYSAKDASDFARKATEEKTSQENQASGGQKPLTGTTQPPKAPAAQAATQPPATSSTPYTNGSVTYGNGPGGSSVVLNRHLPGDPVAPSDPNAAAAARYGAQYVKPGGATPAAQAAAAPAGAPAGSAAVAASSAPAPATAGTPAQAFNALRSPLSMFPATPGLQTAAQVNAGRQAQGFGAAPTDSSFSSFKPNSGDTSDIKWKRDYHAAVSAAGFGVGSEARERANAAAGMGEAQAAHMIKHHQNPYAGIRASASGGTFGGTDMARPSMFGGPAMPSPADPTSGFGFDPHAPTQTPDNLRQIAVILASPPSPSPSALEAAVRECWTLDPQSGQPLYTGHFADNAAKGTQAVPNGGLLGAPDQETPTDVSAEGGAEPPPLRNMPAPGGKPAMFAEGGTSGTDRRVGPNATYDPRWGFLPKQPTGAVANPSSDSPTVSYSGLPPAPQPPAAAAPVAASGGGGGTPARSRAPAARAVAGGPRAEQPSAPSADIMRKVTNYYLAQFGGTPEAATSDLQSGSADATNWLRSALGMAMAGQLDQYDSAPATPAPDAAPATPAADKTSADAAKPAPAPAVQDTRNADWQKKYMARQAQGAQANYAAANPKPNDYAGAVVGGVNNGLRLSGGRVTTSATPLHDTTPYSNQAPPHPDEVKSAIAGMTYDDAVAYINSLYGRAASAVSAAPRAAGGTDFVYRDDPSGGFDPGSGDWYTASGGPTETGRMTLPGAGGGLAVPINGPLHQAGVYNIDPRYTYDPAHRMAVGGTGRSFFDPFGTNVIIPNPIRPPGADPTYVQASGEGYDPPDYTYDEYGVLRGENPVRHLATGGTTFVARRPTMFNAGGQQFLVGEDTRHGHPSGADELVSISDAGGQTVVHVDPLQRRGTGIPPAVAATANLAVPGSPYRPKVGIPASAVGPGRADAYADGPRYVPYVPRPAYSGQMPDTMGGGGYVSPDALGQYSPQAALRVPFSPIVSNAHGGTTAMPMDPSMGGGDPSMGGDPSAGLPDVIPLGNGVVLVRQPDGSYLPMDAQQMQAMLGGGSDPSSMGGDTMSAGAGPSPMAAGGTRVYGTVAPGATISRVGGQPSATGQVKVPGGRGGSTTQPFYAVQPFPNPEYALSRNVDQLTPDELQQVGLVTQNRAGYNVNQWAALQARGRLMSQAPAVIGAYSRPF